MSNQHPLTARHTRRAHIERAFRIAQQANAAITERPDKTAAMLTRLTIELAALTEGETP